MICVNCILGFNCNEICINLFEEITKNKNRILNFLNNEINKCIFCNSQLKIYMGRSKCLKCSIHYFITNRRIHIKDNNNNDLTMLIYKTKYIFSRNFVSSKIFIENF